MPNYTPQYPLKTVGEYLTFTMVQRPDEERKTPVYQVTGNLHGTLLGEIKWHSPWRRFVFKTANNILFDTSCMAAIIGFISGLKAIRSKISGVSE